MIISIAEFLLSPNADSNKKGNDKFSHEIFSVSLSLSQTILLEQDKNIFGRQQNLKQNFSKILGYNWF